MSTEKNRAMNSRFQREKSENSKRNISSVREISGLLLEKWANLGTAISHAEDKIIFVKGGIPGETVRIRIDQENSKLIWGTVIVLEKPSPLRISSDCSSFPECGGCSYRQISYEEEIRVKKELLLESLIGFAKFHSSELPEIQILKGPPNEYRNTAQIKLGKVEGRVLAGFFKWHSNSLIPLPEQGCRHLPTEMNEFVRSNLLGIKFSRTRENWKLRFSSGKVFEYKEREVSIGPYLPEKISWSIPADGFTQVNRFLLEEWMFKIRSWVPEKTSSVMEFYSGAGLISLSIASRIEKLIGYELSKMSVAAAEQNAKSNGYSHIQFYSLDLNSPLPKELRRSRSELCILNPPRAGASSHLLNFFTEARPERIIYSSCNHSTLSRDLKVLKGSGYKISEMVLTDFFPRTQHFEVLVLLTRSS